jgi:hypothetical protein
MLLYDSFTNETASRRRPIKEMFSSLWICSTKTMN